MKAIVQAVLADGPHGPYAVAVTETQRGSITFSLNPPVWNEESLPEPGTCVILSDLWKKRLGWRASRARLFRSQDETSANSELETTTEVSEAVQKIVEPLHDYWNSYHPGWPSSIGGSSCVSDPRVTHADFVLRNLPKTLHVMCDQVGLEEVLEELVSMTLPVYRQAREVRGNESHAMGAFWGKTLLGGYEGVPPHRMNSHLVTIFGIKGVYGPILSLAGVHGETQVFGTQKFFHTHANRLGEILVRFGTQGLVIYTDQCKKLLRGGLYDWSLEQQPEVWEQLEPCIRRFGLEAILEPVVEAMLSLSHIPGSRCAKYKYSFLGTTIRQLLPHMLPFVMEAGPKGITTTLNPIISFVTQMHKEGAFRRDVLALHEAPEPMFFYGFTDLLPTIQKVGMRRTLDGVRSEWKKKLIVSSALI